MSVPPSETLRSATPAPRPSTSRPRRRATRALVTAVTTVAEAAVIVVAAAAVGGYFGGHDAASAGHGQDLGFAIAIDGARTTIDTLLATAGTGVQNP